MSEEETPDPAPLPMVEEIPPESIERWRNLPDDAQLAVPFSKAQLMYLVAGLRQSTLGLLYVGDALQALDTGDREKANEAFRLYQISSRQAYNAVSGFLGHVMLSAQVIEADSDA